ncbi:hypothetical protein MNBD_GAMMA10-3236 [hydrothermal vent metagenome]|uniref:Uncharacterized protein n=1 Tax=hydrothermal vent metagenome TaxID=652676 RepID=A0A3B0Y4J6_9ZZZZ
MPVVRSVIRMDAGGEPTERYLRRLFNSGYPLFFIHFSSKGFCSQNIKH